MKANSLNREEIEMLEAIKSFDTNAFDLIERLATKFDLDLKMHHPFTKLFKRSNNLWKGDLDEDYTYRFHGSHVCFEHKVNGQSVDVYITEKGEYGTFDYSSLRYYIKTTTSFKYLLKTLDTFEKFERVILSLEKQGFLVAHRFFIYVTFKLIKT
jgi:hypothetical protein